MRMATFLLLGAMASVPLHAMRNDDAKDGSSKIILSLCRIIRMRITGK